MSTFNDIDIVCDQCGEEFRGTIWTAVHAGEDPELKELLLGGELNMVMCPQCAHIAYQDHFVLYQDPAAELVAYVHPPAQQTDAPALQEMMLRAFQEAQEILPAGKRISYQPVLLFGLESLVEMLNAEDLRAEQSQVAEAICRDHGIATHVLRPSQGRRFNLMRVLPLGDASRGPVRDNLIDGVKKLLDLDPALDYYRQFQSVLQNEPDWRL